MEIQTEPDPLAARIRAYVAGRDELLKDESTYLNHPLAGHCYTASEAYYHLTGGEETWTPQYIKVEWIDEYATKSVSHWFLKHDERGTIVDLTAEQFEEIDVPYEHAVGKGFMTGEPSNRSQQVINAVQQSS